MAQGRVGTMVAAMSLRNKTRWGPGCGLRQDWDRKSLEGGCRLVSWQWEHGGAWGLLFWGVWCLSVGGSRSRPRVGGGGGGEEGGQGRREAPREQERAAWPCWGCGIRLLPRTPLSPHRDLPEPGDSSCVIISPAVG